jgi:hypothetical protein
MMIFRVLPEDTWGFCITKLANILGVYLKLLEIIPLSDPFIHAIGVFFSNPLYPKRYRMSYEEKLTNFSFLDNLSSGFNLHILFMNICTFRSVYFSSNRSYKTFTTISYSNPRTNDPE